MQKHQSWLLQSALRYFSDQSYIFSIFTPSLDKASISTLKSTTELLNLERKLQLYMKIKIYQNIITTKLLNEHTHAEGQAIVTPEEKASPIVTHFSLSLTKRSSSPIGSSICTCVNCRPSSTPPTNVFELLSKIVAYATRLLFGYIEDFKITALRIYSRIKATINKKNTNNLRHGCNKNILFIYLFRRTTSLL